MDADRSPLAEIRARVSKSPLALPSYDAFESMVKAKLVTWPRTSAERAGGYIVSVWAAQAAKTGGFKIPHGDLHWIVSRGKVCRRALKGAEAVWARELAAHLLLISKTKASSPTEAPRQETAPG